MFVDLLRHVSDDHAVNAPNGYSTVGKSVTIGSLPLSSMLEAQQADSSTFTVPVLPPGQLIAGAPIFQVWPSDQDAQPIVYQPELIGGTVVLRQNGGGSTDTPSN